jgi:hypothetical protein
MFYFCRSFNVFLLQFSKKFEIKIFKYETRNTGQRNKGISRQARDDGMPPSSESESQTSLRHPERVEDESKDPFEW